LSENRNIMNFLTFRKTLHGYPVFSIGDIEKIFPDFNRKNLANWQQKKYIQKIRNSWYRFSDNDLNENALFFISNQIYAPSYISLESALSHYGFIPEGVFQITAISTLKTDNFDTPIGYFNYQNLKPNLFFGYKLLPFSDFYFKMAEPEKTILDYLYLHSDIQTEDHLFELRLNAIEINQQINFDTLNHYCDFMGSKSLKKRVNTFIKFIKN
jgi:predicted transcriptional regulator of viral defense system